MKGLMDLILFVFQDVSELKRQKQRRAPEDEKSKRGSCGRIEDRSVDDGDGSKIWKATRGFKLVRRNCLEVDQRFQ